MYYAQVVFASYAQSSIYKMQIYIKTLRIIKIIR